METHKEWIGGLKSWVSPLKPLANPPNLQISRLKGGSGSATLRPVRATVDSGDLWGESGRTRAKPVCGVRSLDREAKVARGRIELPTRGFSVLPAVFSIPEQQPASDSKRYYIGTSAAAIGGRCAGSWCTCLMVRGTTGGQSARLAGGAQSRRAAD